MCGRYCLTTTNSQINEQFRADSSENSEITSYNIAPSNQILKYYCYRSRKINSMDEVGFDS